MRSLKTRAFVARTLLGGLGCGTSEWETQSGLGSKCIVSSYTQGNVLGLWWWPQRSAGYDGNCLPLRSLAPTLKCVPVILKL